jgi:general stress protein YciG
MGGQRSGFASMPPDQRKAAASKGGKLAHAKGVAYEWTPAEAREAGKLGGKVSAERRWGKKAEA